MANKHTILFNKPKAIKITVTKIKKELLKNYGWLNMDNNDGIVNLKNELIKDTLKVINDIILKEKGFTINK